MHSRGNNEPDSEEREENLRVLRRERHLQRATAQGSDYIDFPVSPDWLDHYHRMGLTPRSSGRIPRPEPEVNLSIQEGRDELLVAEVNRLKAEVARLRGKRDAPPTRTDNHTGGISLEAR